MGSERRTSFAERAGWTLAAVVVLALGALWRLDRTRVWEIPRWDGPGMVVLRAVEPGRARGSRADSAEASAADGTASAAGGAHTPAETWAVAVNPRCELCRTSLARGLALGREAHAPVRLAALVVDTRRRPSAATVASLAAGDLRWDSTGAWRRRWGHRIYGELLCFDRAGGYVRTLAPLTDSLAARRALRIAQSLRRGGGS